MIDFLVGAAAVIGILFFGLLLAIAFVALGAIRRQSRLASLGIIFSGLLTLIILVAMLIT